jgi:hypothetical protein
MRSAFKRIRPVTAAYRKARSHEGSVRSSASDGDRSTFARFTNYSLPGLRMRVLLVEDDSGTTQSVELMLKTEGLNVCTTHLADADGPAKQEVELQPLHRLRSDRIE